jgi:hypothetical protein
VAPIAPDPFVPELSTPVKLITVIEEVTLCQNVTVIDTLVSVELENARQISAVPSCTLVLWTRTHGSPTPVIFVTVVLGDETRSDETNARRGSSADVVENTGVVTVLAATP